MFAASELITIFPDIFSGNCRAVLMNRLSGSFSISSVTLGLVAGFVCGEMSKPAYNIDPSGEKTLPPWFCCVLKLLALPPGNENGALAAFCCASTVRVLVSNSVKPAMNFEPSLEIERTLETLLTVLACSTVAEETS